MAARATATAAALARSPGLSPSNVDKPLDSMLSDAIRCCSSMTCALGSNIAHLLEPAPGRGPRSRGPHPPRARAHGRIRHGINDLHRAAAAPPAARRRPGPAAPQRARPARRTGGLSPAYVEKGRDSFGTRQKSRVVTGTCARWAMFAQRACAGSYPASAPVFKRETRIYPRLVWTRPGTAPAQLRNRVAHQAVPPVAQTMRRAFQGRMQRAEGPARERAGGFIPVKCGQTLEQCADKPEKALGGSDLRAPRKDCAGASGRASRQAPQAYPRPMWTRRWKGG